jgi:hypothetical protein
MIYVTILSHSTVISIKIFIISLELKKLEHQTKIMVENKK